jgi:hypothetical protein
MPTFDWPSVKAAVERGLTPTEIAKTLPNVPTRQAIEKRMKREGWVAALPKTQDNAPVTSRDMVLMHMGQGATYEMAAAASGIGESTLRLWRTQDPVFDAACKAKRAAWLTSKVKQIDDAPDWKAAAYLLERAPETKDQYGQKQDSGGVQIILNITRDEPAHGTVIDHEP